MRCGLIAGILWLLCGCSVLAPARAYRSIGDFRTTQPRRLAESGRGDPIELPNGIQLVLRLDGVSESLLDARPTRRFEMHISIVDSITQGPVPRARPVLEGAEIVDDSGRTFGCQRALIPVVDLERHEPGDQAVANHTFVFELPVSYRFRQVSYATVHWQLRIDGGRTLDVSSRFRS